MTRRWIAIADVIHVGLALLLAIALAVRFAPHATSSAFLWCLLGVPLGFLSADAASGVVHWFGDTCFRPSTPVLGPMLIAPFREHHTDPAAISRHSGFELNGNNCLAAAPLLGLSAFGPWHPTHAGTAFGLGWLATAALTLCMTNQIHAWAHAESVPALVRALQRRGVLLAPERHARHHAGAHAHDYAVVCGWSNRWLDAILSRARRGDTA